MQAQTQNGGRIERPPFALPFGLDYFFFAAFLATFLAAFFVAILPILPIDYLSTLQPRKLQLTKV